MVILITGATGYIGREFIKRYQNKFQIIALVRNTSDISKINKLECRIERFDNYDNLEKVFRTYKIKGIVHFASAVIVDHIEDDINPLVSSNIEYGTFLLEFSKKYNLEWFINTGTFWQNYDSLEYNPVNLYAATKEAFQTIAKYYTETSNLIFTTIKLNDTFGANDTRPKIFNLWDKYSKLPMSLDMSDGEQIMDISYIEDVLNAFEIMIINLNKNAKKFNNNCYIVSSNQRMNLKDLAKLFEKTTDRKLKINWGERPYRNREIMIPLSKIQTVPNWNQKFTLEEAIIKTLGES